MAMFRQNEKSKGIFKLVQEMKVSLFFYFMPIGCFVHLSVSPIAW